MRACQANLPAKAEGILAKLVLRQISLGCAQQVVVAVARVPSQAGKPAPAAAREGEGEAQGAGLALPFGLLARSLAGFHLRPTRRALPSNR